MVEKLAQNFGEKIVVGGKEFCNFPTLEALTAAHSNSGDSSETRLEQVLKREKFGYRARYIAETVGALNQLGGMPWLLGLRNLEYKKAHEALQRLPGIGAKVADCVCLMCLDHPQAVPIDTHVLQITARHYMPKLDGIKIVSQKLYTEIGNFYREKFGHYAGWAHDILFCADLNLFKPGNSVDQGLGVDPAVSVRKEDKPRRKRRREDATVFN